MRLRTFTGRSTADAMAAVRAHLGPEAIIVSAQDDGNGNTRVTAALDDRETAPPESPSLEPVIGRALDFHGPALALREKLVEGARASARGTPSAALATGLAAAFRFAPLGPRDRVILLVGPPGGGKTLTAAKLATRDVLAGRRPRLVTTDRARPGGAQQLEAFAKILGVSCAVVDGPAALGALIADTDPVERLVVDTAGTNPFSTGDRQELAALIAASVAEPVLVFAAGGDGAEGAERARVFADLGCARVIATQLDATRRLGGVLTAAAAADLAFTEAGIAPDVADGIVPLTPGLLAHLLLPKGSS